MNFIFDCDDVLLDWLGGFKEYLADLDITPQTPEPKTWSLDEWLGVSAVPLIKAFNTSEKFGHLRPTPGSVEPIQRLHAAGHSIRVLSSCIVRGGRVKFRRENNLKSQFGDIFSSIDCILLGAEKSTSLKAYATGVWVEDNYGHAVAGALLGHETWMIRRPHNRRFEGQPNPLGINWVDSVQDLLSHYM